MSCNLLDITAKDGTTVKGLYIKVNSPTSSNKFASGIYSEKGNFSKLTKLPPRALSMTITKITSEKDNVYTQMIHLYFGATIISILFFIFTGQGQHNNFTDPTFQFIFRKWFTNPSYAWPFIVAMGCIGAVAFFFVFSAYTVASPSVISLYEYSLIIWSILTGYILFNDVPTIRTFFGVSIIIGAGIYIYFREKVKDQMIVTDTPNR